MYRESISNINKTFWTSCTIVYTQHLQCINICLELNFLKVRGADIEEEIRIEYKRSYLYMVSYFLKWIKTSWTYSAVCNII